ncbi:MAG: AAA family ATPase [Bythopirellula sp.]|nr:AAA family ATPase [Bythopirellula sp.]
MHATHWGLEKPPFPTGGAESVFFAGLPQQEALARLRFLVHNERRLGLMFGKAGWGKSLVLDLFAEECLRENWQVARLNLLGLSVREFQWQLAVELHAGPRTGDDSLRLARRLEERLQQNHLQGERAVLLLDDADQAGADVLTQLVRLVQLPAQRVGNLTLVLAANPAQVNRLGSRLLELVDLRIDLEPWDAEDTTGFLQLSLVAAGADQPIFDEAALAEIHRLSRGVPRMVNRLADYAMVAGSSAGLELIDEATIAASYEAINPRTH